MRQFFYCGILILRRFGTAIFDRFVGFIDEIVLSGLLIIQLFMMFSDKFGSFMGTEFVNVFEDKTVNFYFM